MTKKKALVPNVTEPGVQSDSNMASGQERARQSKSTVGVPWETEIFCHNNQESWTLTLPRTAVWLQTGCHLSELRLSVGTTGTRDSCSGCQMR